MNVVDAGIRTPEALWAVLARDTGEDRLILTSSHRKVDNRLRSIRVLAMDYDHTAALGGHHPKCLDGVVGEAFAEAQRQRQPAHTDDMRLDLPDSHHDFTDRRWIEQNLAIWVAAGMSREHFREASLKLELRPGAAELIRSYGRSWSTVISMGYADIIGFVLERYGVSCHVGGTYLEFVDDIVRGVRPGQPIVTGSRKGYVLTSFCQALGLETHDCLVLGDSFGDRQLFKAGGLGCFVIPRLDTGALDLRRTRKEAIELLWPHIDMVVTGTLLPVHALVANAK